MPLPKLPVVDLDNVNHRRRARETLNNVLDHSFDDSRRRTPAEVTAGVTPVNYAYAPGDVRRYGAKGDGTSDDSAPIQTAVTVMAVYGGEVFLSSPNGQSYSTGTTTINVSSNVYLVGDANEMVKVRYGGTGYVVEFTGSSCGARNLQFINTNVAGSGVRFAGPSQAAGLFNVKCEVTATPGSSRTGDGIVFLAADPDNQFSGGFFGAQVYTVGYKTGHRYLGFAASLETWTCVTFSQAFIVGPGAGVASTARGIWMDSKTNGVGTVYTGGTCEGFDVGIQFDGGTSTVGMYWRGDLEGNTADWVLGASFNGTIEAHNSGKFIQCGANGTANRWLQRRHLNGVLTEETFYGRQTMVYDHGGQAARWELFRGPESASFISGTSAGVRKFAIQMDDSTDQDGDTNWIEFLNNKMSWRNGVPAIGTWAVGDVMWNTAAAAGGTPGWVCTTAGTPGTWKAMANLAP
jgi:hypothetical protein